MKDFGKNEREGKAPVDKVRKFIRKENREYQPNRSDDPDHSQRKPRNELKLNKFHQIQGNKKKKRSLKKQVAGIEHLLKRVT